MSYQVLVYIKYIKHWCTGNFYIKHSRTDHMKNSFSYIIYYKNKSSKKKGKERIIFLYYSTSKTYTNRSSFPTTENGSGRPGTVNASDPIISTGLSESILKKQTDKQMLLFKGRAIAANKNCKKILMVSNVCISLCLACKIPRGILRGCPRKNGEHNFSTFTDFLIIVQFWFL